MFNESSELEKLREHIDQTDKELLQALAERMMLVQQIGTYKKGQGLDVRDEKRRAEVLSSRVALAKKYGLSEELVGKFFEIILDQAEDQEKQS